MTVCFVRPSNYLSLETKKRRSAANRSHLLLPAEAYTFGWVEGNICARRTAPSFWRPSKGEKRRTVYRDCLAKSLESLFLLRKPNIPNSGLISRRRLRTLCSRVSTILTRQDIQLGIASDECLRELIIPVFRTASGDAYVLY